MAEQGTGVRLQPDRALLVLTAGIGDFVMATPAIRAIRRGFPETHLTLLTNPQSEGLARSCHYLDAILTFDIRTYRPLGRSTGWRASRHFWSLTADLRRQRFGLAVNLYQVATWGGTIRMWLLFAGISADQTAGRSSGGRGFFFGIRSPDRLHEIDAQLALAAALGCPVDDGHLELWVPEASRQSAAARLQEAGLTEREPFAVLNIGSNRPEARWPQEKAAVIARELHRVTGLRILLTGDATETSLANTLTVELADCARSLAGRTDILELAAILERAKVVVTTDSGPMHMAAALGTPIVALFGPGDPTITGPRGRPGQVVVLQGRVRPRDALFWHVDLPTTDVLEAVVHLLSLSRAPPVPGRHGLYPRQLILARPGQLSGEHLDPRVPDAASGVHR